MNLETMKTNLPSAYRLAEKLATMTTYTMMNYETAAVVGQGSTELARESLGATGENGVVSAMRDASGVLVYVPASRVSDMERLGREVVAVYLDPAVTSLESIDEATLTDATATREARIGAAARLCRAADEEARTEQDSEPTWQASGEQIGTIETMAQACDGAPTKADWQAFAAAY